MIINNLRKFNLLYFNLKYFVFFIRFTLLASRGISNVRLTFVVICSRAQNVPYRFAYLVNYILCVSDGRTV